jgi:LPS-assembly lipoprotein
LFFSLFTFHLSLVLSGCGFHLRGTGSYQFPESLSTLRVVVAGSQAAYDPLRAEMEDALRSQAGVTVTGDPEAPALILSRESTDSQVLAVRATGKAAEYRLRYELGFELQDAQGGELAPRQVLRLVRDYTFDPLNVLAKEREEQELRESMRRDAVQQILRRLSKITLK